MNDPVLGLAVILFLLIILLNAFAYLLINSQKDESFRKELEQIYYDTLYDGVELALTWPVVLVEWLWRRIKGSKQQ